MATKTTIAQLNRPITIRKFVYGQDESGGNIKVLVSAFDLLADVQVINNYYDLEQLQLKYGEGFRTVVRYEPSRILNPNDEVTYDGKVHKIRSVEPDNEAQKRFNIIIMATSVTLSNASSGWSTAIKEYHYVSPAGGELSFQDDKLKGWPDTNIILFFRDKFQFWVIRSGSPTTQQVVYDKIAGTFSFNTTIIPMAPGEQADVYFIVD